MAECPSCGARYQSPRSWANEKRCECGQLFWRSVKAELLEKLGSQEKVGAYKKRLEEMGLIRTEYEDNTLTVSGRLSLRNAKSFSEASDNQAASNVLEELKES